MYTVEVTDDADEAIVEVGLFLRAFTHPNDISKVFAKIQTCINSLGDNPTRYRRFYPPVKKDPSIRYAAAGKYLVYFGIDEAAQHVYVLDVQHRARNPDVVRRRLGS